MIKYETDSRKVKPGQTFVAIKGHTVDGHDYINDAIEAGATEIITEKEIDVSAPYKVVPSSEEYLKERLVEEYSDELNKLTLLGVTGTNGKTTTCYLTYQLLKILGRKVAYMGTIGFYFNDEVIDLPNTTPEILTVYKLLLSALEKGCEIVVMEVSSHAIALDRIAGLKFKVGAFTNLTEDHLDYHKTMENYLNTKLEFVSKCDTFIANVDDENGHLFLENTNKPTELGEKGNNFKILDYKIHPDSTDIIFKTWYGETFNVKTNLTSKFNVYNYLTALVLTNQCEESIEDIISVTKDIYPPPGRCETYKVKNGYVVIDYAHTPDAEEKVIDAYKELAKKRIITLIGCGGDRDPIKRPIMGSIATEKSDFAIFTNDNPRTEDEKLIMEDILKGVKKDNYKVIYDRKEAIRYAIDLIEDDDILLLLGKGHEDYQVIGTEKIHLSDKEEVLNYIEETK